MFPAWAPPPIIKFGKFSSFPVLAERPIINSVGNNYWRHGTLVVVPSPKTRSFIINVTLLTRYFVYGPLCIFVFRIIFDDASSACAATVSVHSLRTFRRTEQIHKHCFHCFKVVKQCHSFRWKERELVSLSLWASPRSLPDHEQPLQQARSGVEVGSFCRLAEQAPVTLEE